MARTRIKICGITRPEDALAAADAGADAIGLVFYEPSPRAVTIAAAAAIVAELPPFVAAVGLFVDASHDEVSAVLDNVQLDILQFHGNETPDFCASFGRPWYKALRMQPGDNIEGRAATYAGGRAILLDSYRAGVPGGTGETFDWDLVPALPRPLILAGGLDPENVGAAIQRARPAAVDVSGGVEVTPGVKDHALISAFCSAVTSAGDST